MATATRPRSTIKLRGRSYLALVLTPAGPIAEWLAELDSLLCRSPAAFVGRPVVIDLSAVCLSEHALHELIVELQRREIRPIGIEGTSPSSDLTLPPPLSGGRPVAETCVSADTDGDVPALAPTGPELPCLLLDTHVRSGQSIVFPRGDVTIVGSVASGAEVIAGGSVHIYGALRGRALAGSAGNSQARIFCRKFEPELIAIDSLYTAADDMAPDLRHRPVQAWRCGEQILMRALD
jgi:septum site-determining protein MinC